MIKLKKSASAAVLSQAKVLFTDAEEHNLDGMRSAFADSPQVFEGVNFVINIEARGAQQKD